MEGIESKKPDIKIEVGFEDFVPQEFKQDPLSYFDVHGVNIKSGEITYHPDGEVSEDPTAVKDLPVWKDSEGSTLEVVGKRVNNKKSHVGKSNNPFYEYSIMEIAKELGLSAAEPIAKIEQNNTYLILTKKIPGIRWTEKGMKPIHESNLTDSDKKDLLSQTETLMQDLKVKFDGAGLIRTWKLKDMIADVDIENKKVRSLIPTDWERTKIDQVKLEEARNRIR